MNNKRKSSKLTKIYTIIISMMCVLAMGCVAYGQYQMTAFSYYSPAPGVTYQTSGKEKTDNSDICVHYISGPYNFIFVEVWGSDGTSGDARNLLTNGSTCEISKGFYCDLPNTVYEYYVEGGLANKAYTCLKMRGYQPAYSGTVSGEWAPNTR